MAKVCKKCNDKYVKNNVFSLGKNDQVFEYLVDDNLVGYGVIRDNKSDMIQIYIKDEYQNNHYGSELFNNLISQLDKDIYIKVDNNNYKMIRIIENAGGIELTCNNGIYKYVIIKK